jgi:hypothetical protein
MKAKAEAKTKTKTGAGEESKEPAERRRYGLAVKD